MMTPASSDSTQNKPTVESATNLSPKDADGGFGWWTKTLQYKTGLGLNEDQKKDYVEEAKMRKQLEACKSCEENRDWMMKYSPTVVFMLEQIRKIGGDVPRERVKCDICTEPKYGGFHPDLGIQLCYNYIPDKWVLNDTLAHELVHEYDNTRFKVDWMDIRHHACSEVRAASLSGECAIMTEFWRWMGTMRVAKGHQQCVKRKAVLSVIGHPKCKSKEHAEEIVDEVFRSCFNDTRPFERIYR